MSFVQKSLLNCSCTSFFSCSTVHTPSVLVTQKPWLLSFFRKKRRRKTLIFKIVNDFNTLTLEKTCKIRVIKKTKLLGFYAQKVRWLPKDFLFRNSLFFKIDLNEFKRENTPNRILCFLQNNSPAFDKHLFLVCRDVTILKDKFQLNSQNKSFISSGKKYAHIQVFFAFAIRCMGSSFVCGRKQANQKSLWQQVSKPGLQVQPHVNKTNN